MSYVKLKAQSNETKINMANNNLHDFCPIVFDLSIRIFSISLNRYSMSFFLFFSTLTHNVLQLPEGGDLEALHCQTSSNFDRSTKLDLTTEPPLLGRCC
jgi:hypothetical protein